jgi:hypothetical protein
LNHFSNIKDIANADVDELKEVDNIGEESAKNIHSTIRVDYPTED